MSPPKRRLLYTHLQNYAKRLPFYINRPLQKVERGTQNNEADLKNPPIVIKDDDDNDEEPQSPGRKGRSEQLTNVVHRLREQQRTTPSSLRRQIKEEIEKEDKPSPSWLNRLRQRQAKKRQPVKHLRKKRKR